MSAAPTEVPAAGDRPQECDIIMKGGITSGVVYPLAVVELARAYRFRNIGGTSAGAIAAALTAAAELGRNAPGGGFAKLAQLPGILKDKLLTLFQPSPAARPAFEVLLGAIGRGGLLAKVISAMLRILRFHLIAFLLGAIAGAGVLAGILALAGGSSGGAGVWVLYAVFAGLGGALAAVVAFTLGAWQALNANGFGLCNGLDQTLKGELPLTPWLGDLINVTAGRAPADRPLTFGDLWGEGDRDRQEEDAGLRAINLEVMTTNLTHGRPRRVPFDSHDLYFDPGELGKYFPAPVIEWMVEHPHVPQRQRDRDLNAVIARDTPFRPLPAPADLPVVVAARMSLSFPALISAVPLYAIDWSRQKNQAARDAGKAPQLERLWFSDGGIGSNFPVHFFDGLLPSRPTFGINLRPFHPDFPKDGQDESKNVRFPEAAGQEVAPTWTPITGAFAFAVSILRTMQNWVDNTQMRLPGYRDRVVHVHLDDSEGGLNLRMPTEVIDALVQRGREAGRKLAGFNWSAHRWTRYRTTMEQLQLRLEAMRNVYRHGFRNFLDCYDSEQRPYERSAAWKRFAMNGTDALIDVVEGWGQSSGHRFTDAAPRPQPDLRIGPKR